MHFEKFHDLSGVDITLAETLQKKPKQLTQQESACTRTVTFLVVISTSERDDASSASTSRAKQTITRVESTQVIDHQSLWIDGQLGRGNRLHHDVKSSDDVKSQSKNNYFAEMCCGSEEGSYSRLIDLCITQL